MSVISSPSVAVIIPWSGTDDEWRGNALDYVVAYWEALGIEAIPFTGGMTGDWRGGRPWSKGRAIIEGALELDTQIVVVSDADVVMPAPYIRGALDAVARGARWAIPHARVRRLSQEGTEAVYEGLDPSKAAIDYEHRGMIGGGFVAIRRETLLRCPPDPRFTAWGNEDESWAIALTAVVGRALRGSGTLNHLWHPRAPRLSPFVGTPEGGRLRDRYQAGRRNPAVIREIIEEFAGDYGLPTGVRP